MSVYANIATKRNEGRMRDIFSILGIILNTLGTVFTLWTIFFTKSSYVGTAGEFDNRHNEFPKEKRRVVIGFIGILIGNIFHIVGICL